MVTCGGRGALNDARPQTHTSLSTTHSVVLAGPSPTCSTTFEHNNANKILEPGVVRGRRGMRWLNQLTIIYSCMNICICIKTKLHMHTCSVTHEHTHTHTHTHKIIQATPPLGATPLTRKPHPLPAAHVNLIVDKRNT